MDIKVLNFFLVSKLILAFFFYFLFDEGVRVWLINSPQPHVCKQLCSPLFTQMGMNQTDLKPS